MFQVSFTAIACVITLALVSAKSVSPEPRTLLDFYQFIDHFANRNPLDYLGYGCWCGIGRRGETVMDAIDSCCKTHDGCYEGWTSSYAYYAVNSDWTCGDEPSSGKYKACMCDREAAQCFARNTFQESLMGRCDKN